jgi:hypothetical protein
VEGSSSKDLVSIILKAVVEMELSDEQIQGLSYGLSYVLWKLEKLVEEKGGIGFNDIKDTFVRFADILELRKMIPSTAVKPFIDITMEEYHKLYIKR